MTDGGRLPDDDVVLALDLGGTQTRAAASRRLTQVAEAAAA